MQEGLQFGLCFKEIKISKLAGTTRSKGILNSREMQWLDCMGGQRSRSINEEGGMSALETCMSCLYGKL